MYDFKVLGIKDVSFTDDRGKNVCGCQVYLIGQTYEPGWLDGYEVLKVWIPDDSELSAVAETLQPDDLVQIDFSRKGRVIRMVKV